MDKLQSLTGGRVTILDIAGLPNLLLAVVPGRKSDVAQHPAALRAPRRRPAIAGSYFGAPTMPLWVANLRATDRDLDPIDARRPRSRRRQRWRVRSGRGCGQGRRHDAAAKYEARTTRVIPVDLQPGLANSALAGSGSGRRYHPVQHRRGLQAHEHAHKQQGHQLRKMSPSRPAIPTAAAAMARFCGLTILPSTPPEVLAEAISTGSSPAWVALLAPGAPRSSAMLAEVVPGDGHADRAEDREQASSHPRRPAMHPARNRPAPA